MKFYKRFCVAALALATAVTSFAGCGKKSENTGDDSNKDKYVYVSECRTLDLGLASNEYIQTQKCKDGVLQYLVSSYDGAMETNKTSINTYNLSDGSKTSTDISGAVAENAYAREFFINDDGTYDFVVSEYIDDYSGEKTVIVSTDAQGNVTGSLDITSKAEGMDYISYILRDDEKNLYIVGETTVIKLDKDGNKKYSVSSTDWIDSAIVLGDGTVCISSYEEGGYALFKIDEEKGALGDKIDQITGSGRVYNISEDEILFSSENTTKLINYKDNTSEALWNWIDVDFTGYCEQIWRNEDGSYSVMATDYSENGVSLMITDIKKVEAADVSEKTVLTIGAMYVGDDLKTAIKDFNKSSNDYKVTLATYEDAYSDYNAAVDALVMDLTSGKLDMVYDLGAYSSATNKASIDLMPYFEKDSSINMDDFFSNIFDACKEDGKLYAISPSFSVMSVIGNKEFLPNKDTWTYNDVAEIMDKYPDKSILEYTDGNTFLMMALAMNSSKFIDSESGKCNFESDEFINLLNLAKKFPKELDYNSSEYADLQNGKCISTFTYLMDLESINIYRQILGDNLKDIGFPTESGTGVSARVSGGISILAKSQNQDACWEFAKYYLTSDTILDKIYNGFPIRKAAFDKKMEADLKRAAESYSSGGVSDGTITIEYGKITQADVDFVKSSIARVDCAIAIDEQVTTIVSEECAGFFEGSKSAEDVAKVVQSRVSIYLAESK